MEKQTENAEVREGIYLDEQPDVLLFMETQTHTVGPCCSQFISPVAHVEAGLLFQTYA